MIYRIYVSLLFLLCFAKSDSNLELKIDYYEALIKKGVQDAMKYKPRTDNSDFFANVTDTTVREFGIYDFIIVGAGSSGSVVASRLSENPKWKILLLEAGDEENDLSEIPGLHVLLPSSNKNWGYTTTEQKYGCYGMINGKCPYARGKSVGGSGAINGLMNIRGQKDDYNKWEKWGNPGWCYKNISYYFKKSENSQIPDGEQGYHGFAGPLNNVYTTPESPLVRAFIDANQELGQNYIDVNGRSSVGVGRCQNNVLFGRRVSGGSAYVKPASNRINFQMKAHAFVTKVIIDKNSKTARGVQFVKNGVKYEAIAEKEVILSGGAINTPQLLMLSGIGPQEELKKHGIDVIYNSPVGQTTRDHIAFNHVYFKTNFTGGEIPIKKQIQDYFDGVGPLTTSFSAKAVSFKKFNNSKVEYVIIAPSRKGPRFGAPRNYNKDAQETVNGFNSSTDFLVSVILLHPKSAGKITLKSSDPIDFPDIDIGIYSSEDDLEVMYEAIQYALELGKTHAFQKFKATPFLKLEPCDKHGYGTKEFWFCAMKFLSFNGYHMSSTARMGPRDDPLAVVDSELRVYGINNLRIVDCSIMPDTISGHTNAIAFAIGEKGSDIIKNYYGFR